MNKLTSILVSILRAVRRADEVARTRKGRFVPTAEVTRFNPATGLPLGPNGLDAYGFPPGAGPNT